MIPEADYFSIFHPKGWDWYCGLFPEPEGRVLGEGSVTYTRAECCSDSAGRMAEKLPKAKLIYMVRHPLKRLPSGFAQSLHQRVAKPSFNEEVKLGRNLLPTSLYWERLNEYRAHFPDSQIHVVFLEDLIKDAESTVQGVFEFLGVDSARPLETKGAALNSREEKLADRGWWRSLHRFIVFRWIRAVLPEGVVLRLRPLFRKKLTVDTSWDPVTLEWTKEKVRPDAAALLSYCGKPANFWEGI